MKLASSDIHSDWFTAGFQCLKEDAPQVLGLVNELLTKPRLPQDKLELFKAQVTLALTSLLVPTGYWERR